MVMLHIYDRETGKFMRSQEPKLDPLETKKQGKPVYCTYPCSTTKELPEYGEHELPFFVDGDWVVKGQYKNVEVYNTGTKTFDYCYNEELGEDQVFIDDEEGIKAFKETLHKYIVDETTWTIIENPQYPLWQQLDELNRQLAATDTNYQSALNTPVEFPLNHHLYKPAWTDDGTYAKIITAKLAGLGTFPIEIWDATKLEENMVSMDEQTFGQLCAFLVQIQRTAFDARKRAQALLIPQIEEIEEELGIRDTSAETEEESEEE